MRFVCGDGRKFKKNVVAVCKCGRKKKVGTSFFSFKLIILDFFISGLGLAVWDP